MGSTVDKDVLVRRGDAVFGFITGAAIAAMLGGIGLAALSLSGEAPATAVPSEVAEPPDAALVVLPSGWTPASLSSYGR